LLVGEILTASRVEAPESSLQMEQIRVDELIARLMEEYAAGINERELQLTANLLPVEIITDVSVMYRALSNLISNAVRYTPERGQIRISIEESLLTIENECEPIPETELAKLFEPFYTRDPGRDKSKSGTGLGLHIVARSLERLEIPYTVENSNLGLKFQITINR